VGGLHVFTSVFNNNQKRNFSMNQSTQNPYQMPEANLERTNLLDSGGVDNSKPWSPKGRFGRLSYFAWCLVTIVALVAIMTIVMIPLGGVLAGGGSSGGAALDVFAGLLSLILGIVFIVVYVIFTIRRLHDLNKSGHYLWIVLVLYAVQMVGIFSQMNQLMTMDATPDPMDMMALYASPLVWGPMLVMFAGSIYLMCFPGTKGSNRFGPVRVTPTWEAVVGWIYVALMVLYLLVAIGSVVSLMSSLAN
jgi:uncharacterized membrane protein YhaH (DUF805 family)